MRKPTVPNSSPWHDSLIVLVMKRELLAASKRALHSKSDDALSDAIRSVEFWTEKIKDERGR